LFALFLFLLLLLFFKKAKDILGQEGPWKRLYSQDQISEVVKETMMLYEALSLPERVQYFTKVNI
jgi:hypothetical protein